MAHTTFSSDTPERFPRTDQAEDFPLAVGEFVEGAVFPVAAEQLADERWVDDALACLDPPQGVVKHSDGVDPFLEQVAGACRVVLEQRGRVRDSR
jgi:hypothetical protein